MKYESYHMHSIFKINEQQNSLKTTFQHEDFQIGYLKRALTHDSK